MAKGPLTVLAYSQDDKIKLDEGKLLLVNNQIAQTTGTIQLKATFPNSAHRLWPGQLVNARLLLDTRKDGLTVAAPAVQQGQNGILCLRDRAGRQGAGAPRHRGADQRGPGPDRLGPQGQRDRRRRRPVPADGRTAPCGCCTARPRRKPTCRARSRRQSHELLGAVHPPADRHRSC